MSNIDDEHDKATQEDLMGSQEVRRKATIKSSGIRKASTNEVGITQRKKSEWVTMVNSEFLISSRFLGLYTETMKNKIMSDIKEPKKDEFFRALSRTASMDIALPLKNRTTANFTNLDN